MTHSTSSLQEKSSLLVFSDPKPKMLVSCPSGKRVVLKGSNVRGSVPREGKKLLLPFAEGHRFSVTSLG